MARLRIPQSFRTLLDEMNPKDFMPLFEKYGATDASGVYLHWDKFKWRVEKGDNEEAAWLATKIARRTLSKPLQTLHAENEKYFQFCSPDSLWAQLHVIDKRTGGGHEIGDKTFIAKEERSRFLIKNLLMEESITSSQLEGASTTRKVAKEMLETQRQPKDKSEQMVFNNYSLMKKAVECKDEPLSIDLLLNFHRVATEKAIENDAIPGECRTDNTVNISNIEGEIAHQPPGFESLPDRLTALCGFANTNHNSEQSDAFIHPLVKAIILHFMIGYIHPFGDGNGRTARALFYWFMLKSGYWLFEYVSISKLIQEKRSEYDLAYRYTETDDFDLTYFIYHQVGVVTKAVDALYTHIQKKKEEMYNFRDWLENSPVATRFNDKQLELLRQAVKKPGRTFTCKQVAAELGVNENTARSYLNKLVTAHFIITFKPPKSKEKLYIAPEGLAEKLRNSPP